MVVPIIPTAAPLTRATPFETFGDTFFLVLDDDRPPALVINPGRTLWCCSVPLVAA